MVGVAIDQAYRKVLQTNRNLIVCLTRGGAAINYLALGRHSEALIDFKQIAYLHDSASTSSRLSLAD
jgi:hypothetical protein